jgi:deazaflavin-dependent oxidoreductase (nitroreductase family)
MPIPKFVAAFNKKVTNHATTPFASQLPGFAVVTHRGRRSGQTYRTPVNVFRRGDAYVFALTYGPDVDWVKNVEAAQACDIESRGRTIHLVGPQRFTDPTGRDVPGPVRAILRLIDVDDFMVMHAT